MNFFVCNILFSRIFLQGSEHKIETVDTNEDVDNGEDNGEVTCDICGETFWHWRWHESHLHRAHGITQNYLPDLVVINNKVENKMKSKIVSSEKSTASKFKGRTGKKAIPKIEAEEVESMETSSDSELRAHTFLNNVKQTFSDRPQIYNKFVEMMKELQGNSEMVPKITDVLNGYPDLLEGFNAFLPSLAVSPTKTK